jgi:hypothetical protein
MRTSVFMRPYPVPLGKSIGRTGIYRRYGIDKNAEKGASLETSMV